MDSTTDPVLQQTSWTPISRGGHSWPTHHLFINETKGRAELRSNIPQRKSLIITCEAIGFILLAWQCFWSDSINLAAESQRLGLVWLTCLLIAVPIFAITLHSVVFDLHSGRFWEEGLDWKVRPRRGVEGSIKGIHAIQLLPERIYDSTVQTPFFMSYELNLVNHRGGRLNVIDHSFLHWIRRDAQNLAQFLNVPFWDATQDSKENMTALKMEVMRRVL